MTRPDTLTFASGAELDALVATFEQGEVPEGGFTHQAHLAVALAYLARYGTDEATVRLREGLLRFLERSLGDATASRVKYRETITVFWVRLLAVELAHTDPSLPLFERVNPLLDRYRDASTIRSYYSDERLYSDEARERFVEPDLRPLPTA